jgi:hypothetical protein
MWDATSLPQGKSDLTILNRSSKTKEEGKTVNFLPMPFANFRNMVQRLETFVEGVNVDTHLFLAVVLFGSTPPPLSYNNQCGSLPLLEGILLLLPSVLRLELACPSFRERGVRTQMRQRKWNKSDLCYAYKRILGKGGRSSDGPILRYRNRSSTKQDFVFFPGFSDFII